MGIVEVNVRDCTPDALVRGIVKQFPVSGSKLEVLVLPKYNKAFVDVGIVPEHEKTKFK